MSILSVTEGMCACAAEARGQTQASSGPSCLCSVHFPGWAVSPVQGFWVCPCIPWYNVLTLFHFYLGVFCSAARVCFETRSYCVDQGWPPIFYVTQTSFGLPIFLDQFPKAWDYSYIPLCLTLFPFWNEGRFYIFPMQRFKKGIICLIIILFFHKCEIKQSDCL